MGTDQLSEEHHKKGRQRKKQLYSSILHQMEFYFSDSNLSKDRFLGQLLQESEYIELEVFLKFNKLRKLTTNSEDIIKALRKSELLEFSEDNTKIKRKTPINIKTNTEECTVYVQNIKADATHDWLSHIFSEFGTVNYVSIPKYKHNKAIKGFAFIEFDTEEQAKKTVEFFEGIDLKISSNIAPEELCSISSFHEEKLQEENFKKRQLGEEGDDDNDSEAKVKRVKLDDEQSESSTTKIENEVDQDAAEVNLEDKLENTELDEKKKRKKINKKKAQLRELGMQILTKYEWKKMRNRYLDMQKKKMKQLKLHLNRRRFNNRYDEKCRSEDETTQSMVEETMEPVSTTQEIEHGLIVKLEMSESCSDIKKVKSDIKVTYPDVQYVDIPTTLTNTEAFLRFSSAENAKTFCDTNSIGTGTILMGEEESQYWEKIQHNRSAKSNKDKKKQRGRGKLLKKAERELGKHIRFDESD